jgi:hypothetical protein
MPVTNDNYDQLKIDKLKHYLETQAERNQAKPFEVFVDNLKVVSKTEDPKEFDSYEFYMNEDTEKVRILIYNSHLSPRNDQYCFMVQRNKTERSLNGLGEIENIVQEKLAARDREHEMNRLREELQQTKEELQEAEDYADKLEKEIEYIKENKFKLGNINIGELASVAMEGMIRRNPQFLTKLPGGEALAGIIVQDNHEQETRMLQNKAEPQPEATFQRKESNEQQFSEIEIRQLAFLNQLQEGFDAKQIEVFNIILGRLASEPSKLSDIATLFNINY